MNTILKEREERVKRVRQEQEAERLKKAEEWKQQVRLYLFIIMIIPGTQILEHYVQRFDKSE